MRRRSLTRTRRSSGGLLVAVSVVLLLGPVAVGAGATPAQAAGVVTPMISSGDNHTCALLSDGTVRCWGSNSSGQLGDPSLSATLETTSAHPVEVVGLDDVVQVSAGGSHTCAVRSDGSAWCWGNGDNGRLGNGGTTDSATPVQVDFPAGTPTITQVAASNTHTCAVDADGGAWCWGNGGDGRLGDDATDDRSAPVRVVQNVDGGGSQPPLEDVVQISAGNTHSCAVDEGGGAWCWGSGRNGRLGDGLGVVTDVSRDTQRANRVVDGDSGTLSGVAQIVAASQHSCALLDSGAVRCWGRNNFGQLGNGTSGTGTDRSSPVDVTDLTTVVRLSTASSSNHLCALLDDGTARCWGNGGDGRLGDGETENRSAPVPVLASGTAASDPVELTGITHISAGSQHTCATVAADGGTARCWGRNGFDQLGDGTGIERLNPVTVLASGTVAGGDAVPLVLVTPVVETPPVDPPAPAPSGPSVSCAPDVLAVGTEVTCTVTGGDPDIDILWRAAVNPVIASDGVTLDADGRGTFGFTVPASAAGSVVTVELVEWTAPVAIGGGAVVGGAGGVGGPVPSSVPAGEGGTGPGGLLALIALLGAVGAVGAVGASRGRRPDFCPVDKSSQNP